MKNKAYSISQILLHWLIGAIVIFQLLVNEEIRIWYTKTENFQRSVPETFGAGVHITLGITIFFLMLLRLYIRLKSGVPPLPSSIGLPVRFLARLSHLLLYIFLFSMPISGFTGWYFQSQMLLDIHNTASTFLGFLILFHICAAIFHEGVLGNKVLQRMFRTQNISTK